MEIDEEFVEAVEEELGMGCGAWDQINPIQICEAVIKIYKSQTPT